jgi:threonine aldolase
MKTMIDLRSDTVTKPTKGMLDAMMSAPVGDDVFGEDPTVIALEQRLAKMFGKEAGLFCPSGTMTNQIAIRLHTVPGQEVICHKEAHVYKYEGGGIMVNSLCSVKLVDGNRGRLKASDLPHLINNPEDVHLPVSKLVCLEDTANRGGGAIYDVAEIGEIASMCEQLGLTLHLDGARVFNALIETGVDAVSYGKNFATISICLSKGLGTPVGSVLLGSKEQMKAARRIRKVLGGGMRQAGILAAAGLYALDHHIDRLKEDHRRARSIGKAMQELPFVTEVFPVDTNIVVAVMDEKMPLANVIDRLKEKGVIAVPFGPQMLRMVTHLDVNDQDVDQVLEAIRALK